MDFQILVDYITGKRVIKDEQERAVALLLAHGVCYDFSDEQVRELYDRYHNKELTDVQMTYHIALLYSLLADAAQNGITPSSKGKILLLQFYKDCDYYYLDEPLLKEDIELIGTYFEEPVAVC